MLIKVDQMPPRRYFTAKYDWNSQIYCINRENADLTPYTYHFFAKWEKTSLGEQIKFLKEPGKLPDRNLPWFFWHKQGRHGLLWTPNPVWCPSDWWRYVFCDFHWQSHHKPTESPKLIFHNRPSFALYHPEDRKTPTKCLRIAFGGILALKRRKNDRSGTIISVLFLGTPCIFLGTCSLKKADILVYISETGRFYATKNMGYACPVHILPIQCLSFRLGFNVRAKKSISEFCFFLGTLLYRLGAIAPNLIKFWVNKNYDYTHRLTLHARWLIAVHGCTIRGTLTLQLRMFPNVENVS